MSLNDLHEPLVEHSSRAPTLTQTLSSHEIVADDADWGLPEEEVIHQANMPAKLGTVMGVYIPCLLSIFGVVLFMRLDWAVGQMGIWLGLVNLGLGATIVILTILSISAVSTNGLIRGGGAYYMISRSLGPEFGGSIGLIFYVANAVGSTFYLMGFAESMCGSDVNFSPFDSKATNQLLVSSIALCVVTLICLKGAGVFAKASLLIFVVLISSVFLGLLGLMTQPARTNIGFTSWSSETFSENSSRYPGPTTDREPSQESFLEVFKIIFPAVTGIMAGANMSGDLKDPGKSIPRGTLGAMWTALIIYVIMMFVMAATVQQKTLIVQDNVILQNICFHWVLVAIGIWSSTISSALAAIIGAARVLQALARDNLLPIGFFAKGEGDGDEPRRATLLTWAVAQLTLVLGALGGDNPLDAISPLITNFFLISYAITNLACFVLAISGAPNFRPSFQYFHWLTALGGFLMCAVVMFLTSTLYASVSVVILTIVFVVIHYRAPSHAWGEVSQALIFHQVRKYLLRLDIRRGHVKYWRPQILLLVSSDSPDEGVLDFVEQVKKGGLYVLGHVLRGDVVGQGVRCKETTNALLNVIDRASIKAFADVVISRSIREGCANLYLTAGLGGMKINTVAIGFPRSAIDGTTNDGPSNEEYALMISDAAFFEKNVVVLRNFEEIEKKRIKEFRKLRDVETPQRFTGPVGRKKKMTIDVWLLGTHDGSHALQIQLAYLLHEKDVWKHTRIRVCSIVRSAVEVEAESERIHRMIKEWRVKAKALVVSEEESGIDQRPGSSDADALRRAEIYNHIIHDNSSATACTFIPLPTPLSIMSQDERQLCQTYTEEMNLMSRNLPPTLLIYGQDPVVTTEL